MRSDARSTQLAIRIAFLFCFICSLAPLASAQTGQLAGVVRDSSGAVVPGASLQLQNVATGLVREATADHAGSYLLAAIPPGSYVLRVRKVGFAVAEISMQVEVEQNSRYNLILEPARVKEEVSVSTAPILTPHDGSVSIVIDRRFAENIPLSGRSFHALLELAPGVVTTSGGGISTNGQRSGSAYFSVDGVSANSGVPVSSLQFANATPGQVPATTITGGLNALVSLDALEEFRVQTSSFAPEYGRTPGAQVSIVTRSGTNSYHGAIFNQFRNEALDATDWFINYYRANKPRLRQQNFGGVLGGPVLQNRLFFFGSYEGLRVDQPRLLVSSVPEVSLRAAAPSVLRDIFELFPLPTGPDDGDLAATYVRSVSDPTTSDIYGLKLDFNPSPRTTLFGRLSHTPSSREAQGVAFVSATDLSTSSSTLGLTHILSGRIVAELKAGFTRARFETNAQPSSGAAFEALAVRDWLAPGVTLNDVRLGFSSGESSLSGGPGDLNTQEQWNIVGNVTSVLRNHLIKIGLDYRRVAPFTVGPPTVVSVTLNSLPDILGGRASQVTETRRMPARGLFRNVSLFSQDTWQITRSITATYGLRWDFNPPPTFPSGGPLAAKTVDPVAQVAFDQVGRSLWRNRGALLSPRVGVAWSVDQDARLIVSGGFGVFYDPAGEAATQVFSSTLFPNVVQTPYGPQNVPLAPDLRAAMTTPKAPKLDPPYTSSMKLVDPELKSPRTLHWNVKTETQLSRSDSVSVAYVGAHGDRLLSSITYLRPNSDFARANIIGNEGMSRYRSLQFGYRRRAARGLQALVSYTLSDAKDNASSLQSPEATLLGEGRLDLSASEFDIRHVLASAVTWTLPSPRAGAARALLRNWSMDLLTRFRSGVPFTVTTGSSIADDTTTVLQRPNLVPGEPIYINDAIAPGGRRLNPNAFQVPAAGVQGDLRRNAIRGPWARQIDLGVRRSFAVSSAVRAQIRLDAYNVFNIPNFGIPAGNMLSANFGRSVATLNANISSGPGSLSSLYQWGGSRSLELGVRLTF